MYNFNQIIYNPPPQPPEPAPPIVEPIPVLTPAEQRLKYNELLLLLKEKKLDDNRFLFKLQESQIASATIKSDYFLNLILHAVKNKKLDIFKAMITQWAYESDTIMDPRIFTIPSLDPHDVIDDEVTLIEDLARKGMTAYLQVFIELYETYVEQLLLHEQPVPEGLSGIKEKALFWAISEAQADVVEYLVEKRADIANEYEFSDEPMSLVEYAHNQLLDIEAEVNATNAEHESKSHGTTQTQIDRDFNRLRNLKRIFYCLNPLKPTSKPNNSTTMAGAATAMSVEKLYLSPIRLYAIGISPEIKANEDALYDAISNAQYLKLVGLINNSDLLRSYPEILTNLIQYTHDLRMKLHEQLHNKTSDNESKRIENNKIVIDKIEVLGRIENSLTQHTNVAAKKTENSLTTPIRLYVTGASADVKAKEDALYDAISNAQYLELVGLINNSDLLSSYPQILTNLINYVCALSIKLRVEPLAKQIQDSESKSIENKATIEKTNAIEQIKDSLCKLQVNQSKSSEKDLTLEPFAKPLPVSMSSNRDDGDNKEDIDVSHLSASLSTLFSSSPSQPLSLVTPNSSSSHTIGNTEDDNDNLNSSIPKQVRAEVIHISTPSPFGR